MNLLRKNIKIVSKTLFLLSTFYFLFSTYCHAFYVGDEKSVTVSGSIEETRVTIFGYTSPESRVELSSPKVFAVSYSDNSGYFIFDKTLLPKSPQELCLISTDDNSRRTTPICIPSIPPTNYHTNIGPIILPPTITIDQEKIIENSTLIASGQGIPSSPVNVYIYQVDNKALTFPIIANALGLPIFTTKSDASGNYSFSLPTTYSSNFRLYSTIIFDNNYSPKSNTLTYSLPKITNIWVYISISFYLITILLFFYIVVLYLFPKKHYYPALYSYPLSLVHKSYIV